MKPLDQMTLEELEHELNKREAAVCEVRAVYERALNVLAGKWRCTGYTEDAQ